MIKVSVLGAGNIGTHLCKAFLKSNEVLLLENYNRKGEQINNCPVNIVTDLQKLQKADVYIVTFSDKALTEIPETLSHLEGIILHTSGATPMNALASFEKHGVFYPIQSVRKEIPLNFKEVPIGIEANSPDVFKVLKKLAESISNHVNLLDSQQRLQLHIAAVFANNFSNFMYTQAADICTNAGINFKLMLPLITNTIEKLSIAAPSELQTGPAMRKDNLTIKKHLTHLEDDTQKSLYQTLTLAIQKYYGKEL